MSEYYRCLSPIGTDTTPGRIYEIAETTFQPGWYWLRDDTGKALHFGREALREKFTSYDYESEIVEIVAEEMEARQTAAITKAFARIMYAGEPPLNCSEVAAALKITRQRAHCVLQLFRRKLRANIKIAQFS